jgi:hypothetical protein
MAMPKIKFTTNGANSLIGGFASGDVLVCGDAMARHLVHEARCARYMEPPALQAAAPEPVRARRSRGKNNQEPQP